MYQYAGNDAHAELGACWATGKSLILGLHQKGADYGLMSKMVFCWFNTVENLLLYITKNNPV
jgi:hypothetical protein